MIIITAFFGQGWIGINPGMMGPGMMGPGMGMMQHRMLKDVVL